MPDQNQTPNRAQNETARNQQPPNQNANNNARGNGETNANNCNPIVDKNFAGATPEVNAVMGLVFEKNMTNRRSYTNFKLAIMTYINKKGRAYKQTAYLQKAFDNHSDPKTELKSDEPKLTMPDSGLEKDLSYKEKFT